MQEDREYRLACRTLYPPDGDSPATDAHVMRVPCQTPAPATGGLVRELKAKGHDEGQDTSLRKSPVMVRFSRVWRAVLRIVTPLASGLGG
jgi:hypothetical protein